MRRIDKGEPAGEHSAMAGRHLAGIEHDRGDLALGNADLDAAPSEGRVDRVVVAIDPDERLRRHPDDRSAVDVGHARGERPHPRTLLDKALRGDRADRPMHPVVHLVGPRVEAVLIVEVVREHAARLEVRTHEPVRALQQALRLRIACLEDHPAELELAAERRELHGRAPARGDR